MTGKDSEAGFTLVELILAIVILGIIMGTIGDAIIVGLRVTDTTQTRLLESHDAQMASSYFVTDMQSASNVAYGTAACTANPAVVTFSWDDYVPQAAGTTVDDKYVAAYAVVDVAGEHRFVRSFCKNGSLASTVTVTHFLKLGSAPTVSCVPNPCTATPQSVSISLNENGNANYAYQLSASRRTS